MNVFSFAVEIVVALVMLGIAWFAYGIGRREGLGRERGWRLILGGLFLLSFGALVDISDHFSSLTRFVILGPTPYETIAEKLVGFLGGFTLLAIGLHRWLPNIAARRRAEEAVLRSHDELEKRVAERTAELTAKTRQLEREVRERRRAEADLKVVKEAAEEASRTKSRFLANMSHELRSPLNSVIGFANILSKNPGDRFQPQELRFLDRIRANGEHLLALINDVLDVAKVESGRQELAYRPVDPRKLIVETVNQIKGDVEGRQVELKVRLPETSGTVRADELKLKQVLINLISNALKFTAEGEVSVRLLVDERSGEPLRIDVEDTGTGIPEDELDTIFEAFRQGESSARKPGGTGLGLSISRSLCEAMGFSLRVQSVVGRGSIFSIFLSAEPPEYRLGAVAGYRDITTTEVDAIDLGDAGS